MVIVIRIICFIRNFIRNYCSGLTYFCAFECVYFNLRIS